MRLYFQDRDKFLTQYQFRSLVNWIMVIIVGIVVACVGALVIVLTSALLTWKFDTVIHYIDQGKWVEAFLIYLFISLFLVFVATSFCYFEPSAIGSGVSEIKSYLNGLDIGLFFEPRVIVAKAIGICFSVASGLPIGRKAPMVHVGAALAVAISQGCQDIFSIDMSWSRFQYMRNDKVKSDFVIYGISSGIAAVFR